MHTFRFAFASLLLCMATVVSAQNATSFSDVPASHPAAEAIAYLKEHGILQGYPDQTFRPKAIVNRAEAVKIIVAPLLQDGKLPPMSASVYTDIPAGAWYIPYVEVARQLLKIIDGPPAKTTFQGTQPVQRAQFLKMLFIANDISPSSYGDLPLPLSSDVAQTDAWYYPHMRYAVSASMIMADGNGRLLPAQELTRADVALLLYRFLMYRQDRRTQALLSATEQEILIVLSKLESKDIAQAEFASGRALLSSRGALTMRPDEPLVKGAVKTAEGFRELVLAYKAGSAGDMEKVLTHATEAWRLADRARQFAPGLESVVVQMQTIATNMADEARAILGR